MHNPDSGSFEQFKELWQAQEAQDKAMEGKPESERKHWRIFTVGEKIKVEDITMMVVHITKERLVLRPCMHSERGET